MENTNTLTASELTNLWNSYLANTMAVGVTQYFIGTANDPDVREVLESALDLATYEVQEAKNLFDQSGHPLPEGFTNEDLNYKTPALYDDNIILLVKYILAQDGGLVYSAALAESTRSDVRQYFLTCLTRTANLIDQLVGLMEKKGLFHPKINLPVPGSIEKVHKQSFINGWFSGRRPLNAEEITRIVSNFRNMEVIREFLKSFNQITSSNQLQEHFKRGEQIAKKHLDVFQSLLEADDLPQLPTWENEITESTVAPFSERLMLFKTSIFVASTVGLYGTALSTIMRKDLGVNFSRLMTELALYGEDTLKLMIELGFLDQLPLAKD